MSIIDIKVPTIAESVTEVTLAKWLKKEGDIVALDEPICEFESDKATLELPAEKPGKLIHVAKEGDDLKIGDVVARIDTSASASVLSPASESAKESTPAAVESKSSTSSGTYAEGHPSPSASKILKEGGVDTASVKGSGVDGRITKEDALKAVSNKAEAPSVPTPKVESSSPKPVAAVNVEGNFSRNTRREKMSRMRRTISKRLVSAKNTTAMLTTFNEVDLTEVMALRDKYRERL